MLALKGTDVTDPSSTIPQIADFLDDANRERLFDIFGTTAEATEDFMVASEEVSSSRVFAKSCLEFQPARFVINEYNELYDSPPLNAFRKLVVMEGFEEMAASELAGLILTDFLGGLRKLDRSEQ